jgi:hypothetical protein
MQIRQKVFCAAIAGAVLAACSGHPYLPAVSNQSPAAIRRTGGSELLPAPMRRAVDVSPRTVNICPGPGVAIPGQYIVLFSAGRVAGSTYTGKLKGSVWSLYTLSKYVGPPPSPVPTFSPSPAPNPLYLYYGTFRLKNGKHGCAFLLTTQNGKPLSGNSPYNAIAAGIPKILANHYKATITHTFGFDAMTIHGLSASGGNGTVVLKTLPRYGTYSSGVVTLNGRVAVP